MSAPPTTPATKDPQSADPAATASAMDAALADVQPGDAEFFAEILHEILEIGLQLTRQLRDEAPALGSDKASIAFDRVTRVIRRTMLLANKLAETPRTPARTAPARNEARNEARTRIRAEVQQASDRDPPERPDRDPDTTQPDRLDSIGNGTIPEIIASLCKDLAGAATTIGKPTQRVQLLSTTAQPAPPPRPGEKAPSLEDQGWLRESPPAPPLVTRSPPVPAQYRGSG